LSADAVAAVRQLRDRLSLEDQLHLARLAVAAGSEEMQPYVQELTAALFARIEDADLGIDERADAAELAIAAQPDDIGMVERLLSLVTPQAPPEFGAAVFRALRESRAPQLAAAVLDRTATLAPSARDAAFDLLLSRPPLTEKLLAAVDSGMVRVSDLSLIHKQRLTNHPDKPLRDRAKALLAGGRESISEDRKQVLAELADVARAAGDAENGKAVFTKNCAICHKLRGEGAAVGPDLSGMAVHGKDQLLVHILDPNRDVEGNFVTYTALTADGLVISGMLVGESRTSIDLVDAEGKRHAVLREDIDELKRSGASLMPEGFEKQLNRQQLADLLTYLTDTGGFMPLDITRVATVPSDRGMFYSRDSRTERLIFDDWGPKTVDGVSFYPIAPQNGRIRNVIMLRGPRGAVAPTMPGSVDVKCGVPAKAIHFLSGVSGWGFPHTPAGSLTMIVRLRYIDGQMEDHELKNGVHFADYNGHQDVEGSKLAFHLGRQQLRYFKIEPHRSEPIETIQLIKGDDETAPLVMAITAEPR
jgi:putative heme-binding domain-containing protein